MTTTAATTAIEPTRYERGEVIWQADDWQDLQPLHIASGLVAVVTDGPKGTLAHCYLGAGRAVFPELTRRKLIAITAAETVPVTSDDDRLAMLHASIRHFDEHLCLTLPQRLALLLCRHACNDWLQTTQELLGVCVGGTRETCCLHLSRWKEAGLIRCSYGRTKVRNRYWLLAAVGLSESDL